MDATQTTRQLGRSFLRVPTICFGGNVFGWTLDEAASFAMLDQLRERNLLFIDTADVYSRWAPGNSGGESETILGRWMASRRCRTEVILATKVGAEMGPGQEGLAPVHIASAIEASLRRLQTDYIDLYQAHFEDSRTPIDETLDAFSRLITEGKVKVIGASNYSVEGLEQPSRSPRPKEFRATKAFRPSIICMSVQSLRPGWREPVFLRVSAC